MKIKNKLNKSFDAWVYPKASGITIRGVNNQTNGKDYGIAYEVRLPTSLVGKGQRVRKRFKSASDAEHFAKGEFNNYRRFGSEYGKIDEQTKHEVGLALSKIADSGLGCDDVLKQEDLVKFYQKLEYQFLEEGDEMMVKFLGINLPS